MSVQRFDAPINANCQCSEAAPAAGRWEDSPTGPKFVEGEPHADATLGTLEQAAERAQYPQGRISLDEAERRAAARRVEAAKGGAPAGAMTKPT